MMNFKLSSTKANTLPADSLLTEDLYISAEGVYKISKKYAEISVENLAVKKSAKDMQKADSSFRITLKVTRVPDLSKSKFKDAKEVLTFSETEFGELVNKFKENQVRFLSMRQQVLRFLKNITVLKNPQNFKLRIRPSDLRLTINPADFLSQNPQ